MRVFYDMTDSDMRQAVAEWFVNHTPFTLATFEGAVDTSGKVIGPSASALPKLRVGLNAKKVE